MLTSGPHLAAGTQPPRSFDFDLDVDDVDNGLDVGAQIMAVTKVNRKTSNV